MPRATKKQNQISQLLRAPRASLDWPFAIIVIILVVFGLIMMFSASYANAYYRFNDSYHFIRTQVLFAVVGLIAMFVASLVDYHIYHRFAYIIMGVTIVLLFIVLFMPPLNGARRWIFLPGMTFQPSEIAKFAVIILFAHFVSVNYEKMRSRNFWEQGKYGVLPFLAVLGAVVGLMVFEPHLSGSVLILGIGFLMMFIGGTGLAWFGLAGAVVVVLVVAAILVYPDLVPYALSRVASWQEPMADRLGTSYQTIQGLYAIGSGGLFGLGIGNSRQKHLYVPEPQNDFVFSILCEELGFIGAMMVIILFVLLLWRGLCIASKARDKFGAMIVVGITVQVTLQAVLNIAVVTATIPNTGISLPFFSYGGTSLMMLLGEMGVLLNVSRQSTIQKN